MSQKYPNDPPSNLHRPPAPPPSPAVREIREDRGTPEQYSIMLSPDKPKTLDKAGFEALAYYTFEELLANKEAAKKLADAAPMLYEALEAAVEHIGPTNLYNAAKAALAAAK